MTDNAWKAVSPGKALCRIIALAAPVAFSLFITASNSVMALGWVGQFLKSEVIMSAVSLGAFHIVTLVCLCCLRWNRQVSFRRPACVQKGASPTARRNRFGHVRRNTSRKCCVCFALSTTQTGILTFNIFGISILFGVSSGLNTLLSQAEGRGDETVLMRRLYVNRMVVIMFVTAIPLGILNWFSGYLLEASGQPVRALHSLTLAACLLASQPVRPRRPF